MSEKKFTSWLLRGVKPSTGSGLESPNSTHIVVAVAVLIGAGLVAIAEMLKPRTVAIVLRRTPIEVISKTANGNFVYI